MKDLVHFMNESFNELFEDDAKIKELEKKIDDAEDKAEKAEDTAEDAEKEAGKAKKEASKAEDSIKDEKDFRSYAENKFKEVFGDKLDKDQMKKTIDGILKDNSELVDKGDWGALVGILNKSFG